MKLQPILADSAKWIAHHKDIVDGSMPTFLTSLNRKRRKSHVFFPIKATNRHGSGDNDIQVVTPTKQAIEMAKSELKRRAEDQAGGGIKRKRVKIVHKRKVKPQQKRKIIKKKKIVKRKRKVGKKATKTRRKGRKVKAKGRKVKAKVRKVKTKDRKASKTRRKIKKRMKDIFG